MKLIDNFIKNYTKKSYWDIKKNLFKARLKEKTAIDKRPKKNNNKKQIQYELNLGI